MMLKKVFDYVFDTGIYTSLDYDFAAAYFENGYETGGACSAIARLTDNGMLIGRNMDLNISNKPAYIVRTKVDGCYETVGLSYTFKQHAPDYETVLESGIPDGFRKIIPFISTDVLNSRGLYVETNMRCAECCEDGRPKFICSGTKPEADRRVFVLNLPRYIGEHCATVDEALEYAAALDLYTAADVQAWNFCFLMADAGGHYGLLEIAQNRLIWHDYHQAQTNFYVDENLSAIQKYKAGTGRYDLMMKNIDTVRTEEDMYTLMKKVSYFQIYNPSACRFDPRSEFMGYYPNWTADYVMAEENRNEVMSVVNAISERNLPLSRQEIQAKGTLWESTFTEVVNCRKKTLFVRFFEDDARTAVLNFSE